MAAKDLYHDLVVRALKADGWIITHDPLTLPFEGRNLYVDLGAELPIAAEKAGRKIAVEVKSFLGASDVRDLELTLGQFCLYRELLADIEPDRTLYVAIPIRVHRLIFSEPLGQLVFARLAMRLLVFDEHQERIEQWIPKP